MLYKKKNQNKKEKQKIGKQLVIQMTFYYSFRGALKKTFEYAVTFFLKTFPISK